MLTKRKAVELFDGCTVAAATFMGIDVTGLYRKDDDEVLADKHLREYALAFPSHFPGEIQAERETVADRWRKANRFARRTGHRPEVPDGLTEAEQLGPPE